MEENKTVQAAPESGAVHLDEAYVISKIDQIMEDSKTLWKVLEVLEKGIHDQNIGKTSFAIGNIIEARESTNQALIGLLATIVRKQLGLPEEVSERRDIFMPPPPTPYLAEQETDEP